MWLTKIDLDLWTSTVLVEFDGGIYLAPTFKCKGLQHHLDLLSYFRWFYCEVDFKWIFWQNGKELATPKFSAISLRSLGQEESFDLTILSGVCEKKELEYLLWEYLANIWMTFSQIGSWKKKYEIECTNLDKIHRILKILVRGMFFLTYNNKKL